MISQKSIDQILETSRIEEVVEEYVRLKPSGSNLKGLCPFHHEKTPSFMVSPSKNIFKCFGCGKGGNAVQFLMEHENLSFPESLRLLAKKYQIEIEDTGSQDWSEEKNLKRDSFFLINQFASEYFTKNIFETDEGKAIGLSYFKERAYRENTIRKFGLGYALKEWDHFTKYAIDKSYNIEILRELGLTTQKDLDFFRERVIFPIHNLSGKIIAFAGRILGTERKIAKYINSPESEIYNKSKSLYGIYFAKNELRKKDECILVEGYTDVISLHQAGIENVVASSGTSLTEDQIRIIKRYTQNINILYDSDPAGIKAAMRGIDLILEQDLNVSLVLLPESEDPDSLVKKLGAEEFNNYLKSESTDFILFKSKILQDQVKGDPVKKTGMIKDIVSSIARIPDSIKRSLYIKECGKILNVEEELLVAETNKMIRLNLRQLRTRTPNHSGFEGDSLVNKRRKLTGKEYSSAASSDAFQERDIARLLITRGDKLYDAETGTSMAEYILANISDIQDTFDHPLYKLIVEETYKIINKGESVKPQIFVNHSNPDIGKFAVNVLSSPYEYAGWERKGYHLQSQKLPEENYVNDSLQAIMRLKERKLSRAKKEIEARISALDPTNEQERKILLLTHKKIKTMLSEIQKSLGTVVPGNL